MKLTFSGIWLHNMNLSRNLRFNFLLVVVLSCLIRFDHLHELAGVRIDHIGANLQFRWREVAGRFHSLSHRIIKH